MHSSRFGILWTKRMQARIPEIPAPMTTTLRGRASSIDLSSRMGFSIGAATSFSLGLSASFGAMGLGLPLKTRDKRFIVSSMKRNLKKVMTTRRSKIKLCISLVHNLSVVRDYIPGRIPSYKPSNSAPSQHPRTQNLADLPPRLLASQPAQSSI